MHTPFTLRIDTLAMALALCAATGCTTSPNRQAIPTDTGISIFSVNDFHGHVQSSAPVPANLRSATGSVSRAAGGLVYLESLMARLKQQTPASIVVGAGDLIGASPADSALLDDQPAIEAMNRIGLSLTALGNHELDQGVDNFLALTQASCKPQCALPQFEGARFTYLAANVIDVTTNELLLPAYAIKQVGGYRIAFIGAVTRSTPQLIRPTYAARLRFDDEANAINRVLPQVRLQKPDAIVVVIHEGGELPKDLKIEVANASDCPGFSGAITRITEQLDPEIRVVLSGHTHQAYACKLGERWVVQGGAHGAYVSEVKLKRDTQGRLSPSTAMLHEVAQDTISPSAQAQAFIAKLQAQTQPIKSEVVGTLPQPLNRNAMVNSGDSMLGKLIADAQLAFARKQGEAADLALMNPGGIRTNLGDNAPTDQPYTVKRGDILAAQPFRNEVTALTLSGQDLLDSLLQQGKDAARVRFLQPSSNMRYEWHPNATYELRIKNLTINGEPLQLQRLYRVVMNAFLADGGDGFAAFTRGTNKRVLGLDAQALIDYVREGKINIQALQASAIALQP
jgi:5'-nucleotidase